MTSPSKLKGTKLSANNKMTVVSESNNKRQLSSSSIRLILILSAILLFGMFSVIYTHSKLVKDGGRMAASDISLQSFAPPSRKKFSSLLDRRQQEELQRWPISTAKNSTLVREKITTRELMQRSQQQQQQSRQLISDERHTQKANGMHISTHHIDKK